MHTARMTAPPLPAYTGDVPDDGLDGRLRTLLEATHRQWGSPDERRRMRAFGFRPAVEPGVLKREWHGLAVRVSGGGIRAARPGSGELAWLSEPRTLLLDGDPYLGGGAGIDLIESLLDLISAYERWVEAREGREGRMLRSHTDSSRRRPVNTLAETRRLQRLLQPPRRPR